MRDVTGLVAELMMSDFATILAPELPKLRKRFLSIEWIYSVCTQSNEIL